MKSESGFSLAIASQPFTAVMVDDVVDVKFLWLGFCCELNLVMRSMDE